MNILKDPAYTISQLLDAEKAEFLLWMFVPVMFLPLYTRKLSRYILLIPLVLLNLLSDYQYQHSIYYQYAYASGTLVIYLTYLELSSFRGNRARKFSTYIIILSFLLSTASISSRNTYYSEYKTNGDIRREVHNCWNGFRKMPPFQQRQPMFLRWHRGTKSINIPQVILRITSCFPLKERMVRFTNRLHRIIWKTDIICLAKWMTL